MSQALWVELSQCVLFLWHEGNIFFLSLNWCHVFVNNLKMWKPTASLHFKAWRYATVKLILIESRSKLAVCCKPKTQRPVRPQVRSCFWHNLFFYLLICYLFPISRRPWQTVISCRWMMAPAVFPFLRLLSMEMLSGHQDMFQAGLFQFVLHPQPSLPHRPHWSPRPRPPHGLRFLICQKTRAGENAPRTDRGRTLTSVLASSSGFSSWFSYSSSALPPKMFWMVRRNFVFVLYPHQISADVLEAGERSNHFKTISCIKGKL